MLVESEEESSNLMIELASKVGVDPAREEDSTVEAGRELGGELRDESNGLIDEEAGHASGLSMLALEYAVGVGIASTWHEYARKQEHNRHAHFRTDEGDEGCSDEQCAAGDAAWRFVRRAMAFFCYKIGARKVGHLSVLRWRNVDPPLQEGSLPGGATELTDLRCVVGPFWPFAFCVTYPLIFLISGGVALVLLPDEHPVTIVLWLICLVSLLVALSMTACGDPGILRRHPEKPEENWRWNDQARSFRPPGATYDEDVGAIVTDFDHVCPWTGTAIGEKNLGAFHCFVSMLCVCVIFNVLIAMKVLP